MKIYGIDVSHHQGKIDWAKTASELRRVNGGTSPGFAILRIGYSARHGKGGLYMDGQFLENLAACEKYGVPVGVYFYCYDTSPAAAKITAQQVAKMLSGHKFAYPIYYDVEYENYHLNCGKAQNTAIIKSALETLEQAGYYAAVYCSRNFFLTYTNLSDLTGFDKWEAAYTSVDTDAVQNGLWQFSSKNALGIAGFGSSLDCDETTRQSCARLGSTATQSRRQNRRRIRLPPPACKRSTSGPSRRATPTRFSPSARIAGAPIPTKSCTLASGSKRRAQALQYAGV